LHIESGTPLSVVVRGENARQPGNKREQQLLERRAAEAIGSAPLSDFR
jgi:hypothetical protein